MKQQKEHHLIIVRGGGDIATGTIWTLRNAGFYVLILECGYPSSIRTTVSFSEAVYTGETTVERMRCRRADKEEEVWKLLREEGLALLVDEKAEILRKFRSAASVRSSSSRSAFRCRIAAPVCFCTFCGVFPAVIAGCYKIVNEPF